ncbi:hypothetical protein V8F20_007902 [Naviculisporaceae sp. PSN 640]
MDRPSRQDFWGSELPLDPLQPLRGSYASFELLVRILVTHITTPSFSTSPPAARSFYSYPLVSGHFNRPITAAHMSSASQHRHHQVGEGDQNSAEGGTSMELKAQFHDKLRILSNHLGSGRCLNAIRFLDDEHPENWQRIYQLPSNEAMFYILRTTLGGGRYEVIKYLFERHALSQSFRDSLVVDSGRDHNTFMSRALGSCEALSSRDDDQMSKIVQYLLQIMSTHPSSSCAAPDEMIRTQTAVGRFVLGRMAVRRRHPVTIPVVLHGEAIWQLLELQTPLEWSLLNAGLPKTAGVLARYGADLGQEVLYTSMPAAPLTLRHHLFIPTRATVNMDEEAYLELLEHCWRADKERFGTLMAGKSWLEALMHASDYCTRGGNCKDGQGTKSGQTESKEQSGQKVPSKYQYWDYTEVEGRFRDFPVERFLWGSRFNARKAYKNLVSALPPRQHRKQAESQLQYQSAPPPNVPSVPTTGAPSLPRSQATNVRPQQLVRQPSQTLEPASRQPTAQFVPHSTLNTTLQPPGPPQGPIQGQRHNSLGPPARPVSGPQSQQPLAAHSSTRPQGSRQDDRQARFRPQGRR